MEVQQHVRPAQHGLGLAPRAADEAWIAVQGVEQRPALEPELLHPLQEGRDHVGLPVGIAGGAQLLEPVDVAPQAAEPQGVLQVHPEVATAVGEAGDLVDRDDGRGHVASAVTVAAVARAGRSWNPINWIRRWRTACRTRVSHSVRSSSSRSTR